MERQAFLKLANLLESCWSHSERLDDVGGLLIAVHSVMQPKVARLSDLERTEQVVHLFERVT